MLEEKTYDAGAVSVNYAEGPASGPPLVLLHGGRPEVATEVDHIQPLTRGGGHEWENLQAPCKSCHSRKTGFAGR